MNFFLFTVYTALGAGLWVCVLAAAGYLIGANEALLKAWLKRSSALLFLFAVLIISVYLYFYRRRRASL